jgi:hypothetical protein
VAQPNTDAISCPDCGQWHTKPEGWANVPATSLWRCDGCAHHNQARAWVVRSGLEPVVWWLKHGPPEAVVILCFRPAAPDGPVFPMDNSGRFLRPDDWRALRSYLDEAYAEVERGRAALPYPVPDAFREPVKAQRRPSPGYVYVLHGESGHYKIGRSSKPGKRLEKLATQAPYSITLLHSFPCEDAALTERALHAKFRDLRVKGEWFALSVAEVAWLKTLRGDWWGAQG